MTTIESGAGSQAQLERLRQRIDLLDGEILTLLN